MQVARPVLLIAILFASGTAAFWIAEGFWDQVHGGATFNRPGEILVAALALGVALLPAVRGLTWFVAGCASSIATWGSFQAMRLRFEATNVNSITISQIRDFAFYALGIGLVVLGVIIAVGLTLGQRRKPVKPRADLD